MPWRNLVIKQLKATFPDFKVYDEVIQQGLVTPCFIVNLATTKHYRRIHKQLQLVGDFIITYIPDENTDIRQDMHDVKYRILSDPEWRYLDRAFHIQDLVFEIKEDTMLIKFRIKSDCIYVIEPADPMEAVNVGTEIYYPVDNPGIIPTPTDPNNPDPENPNPDGPGDMEDIEIKP